MTIGEWIDRSGRSVPAVFRRLLDADGAVSAEALLQAAEREAPAWSAGARRDRGAALCLLRADAYITYACLWVVRSGGVSRDLRWMTRRVAAAARGDLQP